MAKRKRFTRARRYYGRARARASKMTVPVAVLGGIIGAPSVRLMADSIKAGQWNYALIHAGGFAGIDETGKFNFAKLQANYMPILAGVLVHKLAGRLGINAMLGKAKIPLLRV
jgi:hypothetical protein